MNSKLALLTLVSLAAHAQPANPRRVADLATGPNARGSGPQGFTQAGPRTYFRAIDAFGSELWASDGTGPGTYRVTDLMPGPGHAVPVLLGAVGDKLVFTAARPDVGREVFVTQGTAATTLLLKDIVPGAGNGIGVSFTADAAVLGGFVYFAAGGTDVELWRTDGTPAGTTRVADLAAGTAASSNPNDFVTHNGRVLFTATTAATGTELWATDGTTTSLVIDLFPGPSSGFPRNKMLSGSLVYFAAQDGVTGTEPYRSDGTAAGTQRVADLNPGAGSSSPYFLTPSLGGVWFGATTPATGYELFFGSSSSVSTLDIVPGAFGAEARSCIACGTQVLCTTTGYNQSADVYSVSLGSATPIADLNPGPGPGDNHVIACDGTTALASVAYPNIGRTLVRIGPFGAFTDLGVTFDEESVTLIGTQLWLAANDGRTGSEPYRMRAAFGVPALVADIQGGTASLSPFNLTADGDRVLFFGEPEGLGQELFESRGTAATTRALTTTLRLQSSASIEHLGSQLLLFGQNLWSADATTFSGFQLLAPVRTPYARGATSILFPGSDPQSGVEPWTTDGTLAGTRRITEVVPGVNSGVNANGIVGPGTWGIFASNDGSQLEPWVTDGTAAGTRLLADLNPGPTVSSSPSSFVVVGNRVVFTASTAATGTEMFVTDGTTANTRLLLDVTPGTGSSAITRVKGGARHGFFSVGSDLWVTDGTSAGTLKLATGVSAGTTPVEVGTRIFFAGDTAAQGRELWVSDGTAAGTAVLTDLLPGALGSAPAELTAAGNTLVFAASAGDGAGLELWRSDGTVAGTKRVSDLAAGEADSAPHGMVAVGSRVYFVASDLDLDQEVYVYELDTTAPGVVENVTGQLGTNGFYTSDVGVSFTVTDAESSVVTSAGCAGATVSADTAGQMFTCDADSAGGHATKTVTVKRDTQAPVVSCPDDVVAEATSASGAMVSAAAPMVSDAIDPAPMVVLSPAGSTFGLGTVGVRVTAKDAAGHASECRYLVTVRDTAAPVISCPGDQTLAATSAAGAVATFELTATDVADAAPLVLATHASGSVFGVGTTPVKVTVLDRSGNTAACAFNVTVSEFSGGTGGGGGCGCNGGGGALLLAAVMLVLRSARGRR